MSEQEVIGKGTWIDKLAHEFPGLKQELANIEEFMENYHKFMEDIFANVTEVYGIEDIDDHVKCLNYVNEVR